eukprot:m.122431 g.122431  ORF g.122431 m.122431 type:complete len:591 (-) comp9626_c0_seq6:84-1856(-)
MGIGRKSIPKGHELRLGNGRGFIVCRLALAKKRVNLVNKNDAGLQLFRNGEQSVNQLLALAVPLVHKGRRLKIDKGATALLGKSLSSHGLATTRRAKQQNTLGRAAEARIEEVWPRKREHNVLLEGGNGFLEAANTLPANGEVGGVDHVARNHVLVLAELDTLASKTVHQSLSRNSAFGLAAALGVGALEKPLEAEKEDNLNCPHKHQLAQQVRLFAGRQHCCRPVACGLCTSSPAAAPAASRGAPMPFLRLHWAVATSACVIGLILVPVLWTQLCFHMAYLGLALLLPLAVFLQIDRQRARTQSPMHHVLQRARRRLLASMAVFFALFAAHCLSVSLSWKELRKCHNSPDRKCDCSVERVFGLGFLAASADVLGIIGCGLLARGSAGNYQYLSLEPATDSLAVPPPVQARWALTLAEKRKFFATFTAIAAGQPEVSGLAGKTMLSQTGLPSTVLGTIWMLADADENGQLNLSEFLVAMKLVMEAKRGVVLPGFVPNELYTSLDPLPGPPTAQLVSGGSTGASGAAVAADAQDLLIDMPTLGSNGLDAPGPAETAPLTGILAPLSTSHSVASSSRTSRSPSPVGLLLTGE